MNLKFLSDIGINSITQLMVCLTLVIEATARVATNTVNKIREITPLTLETASIWKQKLYCWSYWTRYSDFNKLTDEEKQTGKWVGQIYGPSIFTNTKCITSGPIIILGAAVSVVSISILGKLVYNKWKNSTNLTINTKQSTDESLDTIVKPEEQDDITERDALLDKTATAQQSLPEFEIKKINENLYSGYQKSKRFNNTSMC